jgi:hypothetical protein
VALEEPDKHEAEHHQGDCDRLVESDRHTGDQPRHGCDAKRHVSGERVSGVLAAEP